jgi:hypothetical protein
MTRYNDGYDVGDIVDESWGYDQTNIDFYRIVKRTAKTIWLERRYTIVVEAGGPSGDKVIPGAAMDPEDDWRPRGADGLIRRKLHFGRDGKPSGTSVLGHGWAKTWSGKPKYQTNPLFGH